MGSSFVGRETRRFNSGEAVWVSPSVSGEWLSDDEATVLEDLGTGYIVLQASERVSSYGLGHFVCDMELAVLVDEPARPAPLREYLDLGTRSLAIVGRSLCGHVPRALAHT